MDEIVKYLKALLYLQVQKYPDDGSGAKLELLLAKAGISYKEIADLLDKSEAAIQKSVSRARLGKGTK